MASLFYRPPTNATSTKPQIEEFQISSGAEGSAINRLWGRTRISGQLIWATDFKEVVTQTSVDTGGKGGGGGSQTVDDYSYFCSFAFAFCEGHETVSLGRIWIDGTLIEQGKYTIRFYPGSQTQQPDSWIETVEGPGTVPAFRGTAYLVFEELPLAEFGDRIPQVTAEIIKPLENLTEDDMEVAIQGVCMIPASGEFSYGISTYWRDDGYGSAVTENVHNGVGGSDAAVSLDQLETQTENVDSVLLVIAWFGDDLRAGNCEIRPKAEFTKRSAYVSSPNWTHTVNAGDGQTVTINNELGAGQAVDIKEIDGNDLTIVASYTIGANDSVDHTFAASGSYRIVGVDSATGPDDTDASLIIDVQQNEATYPADWKVNGVNRANAEEVARLANGDLAYGGTPSDNTIVEYIQELKQRGIRVIFYPFIMMDQLEGSGLPDPYGAAEQPPLPWRGRITCDPAPGQPGTVDKTATAATQVGNWFGNATAGQFPLGSDGLPTYSGPANEWGYRRMVLHYAHLCEQAGGVDGFIIGTELRGLTQIRSGANGPFPAVDQMKTLATDVRGIVSGSTKIGYAADWSEYHSYRPTDGSNDVFFNMDPLWDHADIDFIGIDNYLPLSDYRDGDTDNIYDLDYLMSHVEGGEYYDYFYASQADRDNNVKTPISDGAHSEDWVFRQKDIKNWWLNAHRDRPGGVREAGTTDWVPQSKPIWFTEFGCPAVDKGPNQPNVFFDPKSSESALPYFSNGNRDDLIQRRYIEAFMKYWRPSTGNNPTSTEYAGNMVDFDNTYVWTWDARPYPQFPFLTSVWTDAPNWTKGHWITGRTGIVPLSQLVTEITLDAGVPLECIDVSGLFGASAVVRGFFVKDLASARDMLEPLMTTYLFDSFESEGKIKYVLRSRFASTTIDFDNFVSSKRDKSGYSLTRGQETELPDSVRIEFLDEETDYQNASVDGHKQIGTSKDTLEIEVPLVLQPSYAKSLTDTLLQEQWMQRERAQFSLPPSMARIDPTDNILTNLNGRPISISVNKIDTGLIRNLEGDNYDPSIYDNIEYASQSGTTTTITVFGRPLLEFLDIPLLTGTEPSPHATRFVAFQDPWPGAVNLYRDNLSGGYDLNAQAKVPATMGETVAEFYSGPVGLWDDGNDLFVQLYGTKQLISVSDEAVLAGANAIGVKNTSGEWEIVQFATATVLAPGRYRLSRLLRGQLGSEHNMRDPVPAGSRVVIMDTGTFATVGMGVSDINSSIDFRYGPAVYPQDDIRYVNVNHTPLGVGLRPYSPVHLKGVRQLNDDVIFTWIRRTRFNGDGWMTPVPLNEESEAYDLEVMNGSAVVRTVRIENGATWSYTVAQQNTDFGSLQNQYTIRVYQISAVFGRGQVREETIYL